MSDQKETASAYKESLRGLRAIVQEALINNVIDEDNKPIYEATLIQLLNETEKRRQKLISIAEDHKRRALQADSQAEGFATMGAILENVVRGFVFQAQKVAAEDKEREQENLEKSERIQQAELLHEPSVVIPPKDEEEEQHTGEEEKKSARRSRSKS